MDSPTKPPIQLAWQSALPVMLAHFPLGLVFGVLAIKSGYSWYIPVIMSVLVYGGAAQFVALGIMNEGGSLLAITVSCLFIMLRNSFYGLNLLQRFDNGRWYKCYLIFGLVDGTYAILVTTPPYKDKKQDKRFCGFLSSFIYFAWILGTLAGAIVGDYLHIDLSALEFVLVAFFIIMLFEQFLKTKNAYPIMVGGLTFATMLWLAPQHVLIASIIATSLVYLGLFYWREYRA